MRLIKWISVTLITGTLVAGIAIPMTPSPQSWLEFPVIPGLEDKARNIFYHVPIAWSAVLAFLVSMFFGYRYLRTKDMGHDTVSVASAELGFLFCILATVTGSLWAKFNWGSFWNWDPRETSIFILLLIYGAYFALRSSLGSDEARARLSAVYSILAGFTVPFFVFILPRMVAGLHPGAKGDADGSGPVLQLKMAPNMRVVFFAGLIGYSLFFIWLLSLRLRIARMEHTVADRQY